MIVIREAHIKRLRFTGLHPCELAFEVGEQPPLAENQGMALRRSALELHALDGAAIVDRQTVAGFRGPVHRLVRRALLAHHLKRLVDFGISHLELRTRDRHLREVAKRHLRIHFECCAVLERAGALLERLCLEAGIAGNAQLLLPHRFAEALFDGVSQHLLADLGPELLGHHLERHLAGTKAMQLHRARKLLETGLDLAVDLGYGYRHAQPAFEPLERLQIRLH